MTFAKIEDNICVNAIIFNTKEEAMAFDNTLIELPENYGIGDKYDGEWTKKVKNEEEINKHIKEIRIKEIYQEFKELDNIIKRDTEQLYKDINVTPSYQPMVNTIARKEELRKELQELTKVGE